MSGRETLAQARAAEDAVGAAAMKKAIWRLGPFLGLLYLVAYIDRNNAGFAKLEMTAALQITEAAFGFAAGIFFIGYLLFEVPSNLLLEKFGARKWIARIMISWGIVAALTAFVQDATQFAIARFILGIAEAGFFPGVLLYLTLWFPRQYRTQVLAVFVLSNPIANAVAAPLSGWMLELHGLWGLEGWQLVFLLQGVPAVLLAFVVFFWLPDRPQDARWLNPAEQRWITDTLAAETQATEQRHGRLRLGEVFRNGRLWTLIVLFFGVVFGAYGLGMWLPTIVKSMGDFSNSTTGWLVALPNLCAALVMLPWERAARKQGNIPLQTASRSASPPCRSSRRSRRRAHRCSRSRRCASGCRRSSRPPRCSGACRRWCSPARQPRPASPSSTRSATSPASRDPTRSAGSARPRGRRCGACSSSRGSRCSGRRSPSCSAAARTSRRRPTSPSRRPPPGDNRAGSAVVTRT